MSITPYWIKIYAPNFMGRCITAMQRWPRDQRSKPEVNSRDVIKWTSSNERLKHKCVDLSYYNWYLNQIWYRSQISLSTRWNGQIHNLKIQDAGCRHFGFLGYVKFKKNVSSSGLDEDICIKFYGIMHWTLAYTTACTVNHGLYCSTSCYYSLNYTVQ